VAATTTAAAATVQSGAAAQPNRTTASVGTDAATTSTVHAASSTEGGTLAAPVAPQAPVAAPAAAAPAAAASQPALPVPLASQLSGQLASIKALPQGEHVMTLTVNPETFGPVKVVAHITQDGVRLELFGASEQARAALKAALPDLRRDLAGAGLDPKLDLGSGSGSSGREAPSDPSAFTGNGDRSQRSSRQFAGDAAARTTAPVITPTTNATRRGGLDLVL